MMKLRSGIGLLIFLGTIHQLFAQASWPQVHVEARPWTRWWWLGNAVDSEGIAYQLQALHDAGFGGVEITPIYGVHGYEQKEIPYLSPRWMQMLQYTMQQAHRLHMKVDMNNGTGWPFGGPQIPLDEAASKAIFQTYTLHGGESLTEKIIVKDPRQQHIARLQALMAFSDRSEKINLTSRVDTTGRLHWQAPPGRWLLIAVFNGKTLQQVKRAAPGGEGWVWIIFPGRHCKPICNVLPRLSRPLIVRFRIVFLMIPMRCLVPTGQIICLKPFNDCEATICASIYPHCWE